MIASAMFPILRNNLHNKLKNCGITPTHEYVNRGEIWGCDIYSKMYYSTHAYFQIHDFSKLLNVTMQDVRNNSDWKCNYIITILTKGEDGWDDDELDIYIDDKTTLNNLLSMFKGIKDRQNSYDIIDGQKNFDMMEGHDFEHFCAKLLENNGYEKVNVTQGSGDQGIDIIAYRDGIKYGIQCKCYSSDIGNKAVQEVFAGKTFYECHIGVVLTNQYFTKSAIELAKKNGILLWDRSKLLSMVDNSFSE
ncbi:MAG: restriction endonuclease [Clostridia bacterium]|nr:restriction endonuclease [Clostridia bacterium]